MKKNLDKLKNKIKTNKKITIFLFILLLIGVIAGSFFITILSSSDKILVKEYLQNYVDSLKNKNWQYTDILWNSIGNHCVTALVIWLLGISVAGIPIILFLYFCKAFTLGFSIGSIFYVYKLKGTIFSFASIFPHQVINLIAYELLTMYALFVSLKMIEAVFHKKRLDFKIIMGKYSMILGIIMILLLCSCLYETFALPHILKRILSIINK